MEHYAADRRAAAAASSAIARRRFDGGELAQLEPALKPGLAGGWLYERDAHLRPDRLMAELKRVLVARGVAIRENCAAGAFVRENGQARAVQTTSRRSGGRRLRRRDRGVDAAAGAASSAAGCRFSRARATRSRCRGRRAARRSR